MPVDSIDGPWGELDDVVIDPARWRITHLVVQPHHHHEKSRLVPIGAVVSCGDRVELSWSSDLGAGPIVQDTDFITLGDSPSLDEGWDLGTTRSLAWPFYPYYGVGVGPGLGYGHGSGTGYETSGESKITMTFDRVPQGTIEVRRSSEVHSSDGHVIGHVDGFVVDGDGGITHMVLDHGHLWSHREVAIPLADIDRAESDAVYLRATRDTVAEYPSVAFHRHHHTTVPTATTPDASGT